MLSLCASVLPALMQYHSNRATGRGSFDCTLVFCGQFLLPTPAVCLLKFMSQHVIDNDLASFSKHSGCNAFKTSAVV